VAAGAAGREGRPVAKRAVEPFERGEDDAALIGLVTVVEQVAVHEPSLPPPGRTDIRGAP
jgi:hypothetical protein